MEGYNVLCNWKVSNGDLKKIVSFSSINKELDLDSIIVDNCLCLVKNENDETKSKPELHIQSNLALQQIYILSEGSLIEIFGNYNEYLFTCEPDFIDDWEDMAVYQAKINLPNLNNCKLKFIHIKDISRLWIYYIHFTTTELKQTSNHNLINIENVNKLIDVSNHDLSKRAENFKKFFEIYAKNASQIQDFSSQSVNLGNLLKYIDKKCFLELINGTNKPQQSSSASIQAMKRNNSTTLPVCNINNKVEISVEELKAEEKDSLQKYIDKKLNDLKDDILEHVDSQLNKFFEENNFKLNKILKLFEESTNKNT